MNPGINDFSEFQLPLCKLGSYAPFPYGKDWKTLHVQITVTRITPETQSAYCSQAWLNTLFGSPD